MLLVVTDLLLELSSQLPRLALVHTLRSHSYHVHHFWGRMDILGINLLALGGGVSATYYAFYCNQQLQRMYWGLVLTSPLLAVCSINVFPRSLLHRSQPQAL